MTVYLLQFCEFNSILNSGKDFPDHVKKKAAHIMDKFHVSVANLRVKSDYFASFTMSSHKY